MSAARILVVDDEPQIRRVMRTTLSAEGYEVDDARSGEQAIEKTRGQVYELILLDVNMPGRSGLETCRAIRAFSDAAIIMLTVRNTEPDKVKALDAGADDYITKPFGMPELLARIRAALRRSAAGPESGPHKVQFRTIEINFDTRQVSSRGQIMRLTPKEFDLLRYFVTHPNKVLSHRELLQAVWGPDYGDESEYLRVFVNQLRKKLEPQPQKPRHLLTEAWVGYRFHLPEDATWQP